MGGRGEDRFIKQIFPIAGEFLLGDDVCLHELADTIGHHDRIADIGFGDITEIQRGTSSRPSACTRPKPVS